MADSDRRHSGGLSPVTGSEGKGIGFGLFLLIAGIALLGERMGWLPAQFDWLLPAVLIAWGASEVFQRLKGN
jgi:hypothetical protein